jgi:hypothetical protein
MKIKPLQGEEEEGGISLASNIFTIIFNAKNIIKQ